MTGSDASRPGAVSQPAFRQRSLDLNPQGGLRGR